MQTFIYVLIGTLAIIFVVALILGFLLSHKYADSIFKYLLWRKLYSLVQDKDYFLINNLNISIDKNQAPLKISHLIIGDKYIYVIASRYYESDLKGESYSSQNWEVVSDDVSLRKISNPMWFNEQRTIMLAKYLGWDETKPPLFVSIVVTNNKIDYKIRKDDNIKFSYICHKSEVKKLIKNIEKMDNHVVFDNSRMEHIVNQLYDLSKVNNYYDEKNKYSVMNKKRK